MPRRLLLLLQLLVLERLTGTGVDSCSDTYFEATVNVSNGTWRGSVVVKDFDGDGWPDVA